MLMKPNNKKIIVQRARWVVGVRPVVIGAPAITEPPVIQSLEPAPALQVIIINIIYVKVTIINISMIIIIIIIMIIWPELGWRRIQVWSLALKDCHTTVGRFTSKSSSPFEEDNDAAVQVGVEDSATNSVLSEGKGRSQAVD